MQKEAYPFIALLGFLWGSNLVASRYGVGEIDPILFAGSRFAISAIAFSLVYLLSRRRVLPRNGRLWQHAAVIGTISTALPIMFTMVALQYQSSGVTALLFTTAPAFIVLSAHFFLPDERLTWPKLIGVMLALNGALLLAVRGETGLPSVTEARPVGYLLVFLAILGETTGAIYIRKKMQGMVPFDVTAVRIFTATLLLIPIVLLWRGVDYSGLTPVGGIALLYSALGGALGGQLLAFTITSRFGATAFSLVPFAVAISTAVLGVLLLDEQVTGIMLIGMALILAGIFLLNFRQIIQLNEGAIP